MEQAVLDSRSETQTLTEFLGVLATPSRFADKPEKDRADSIVLPTSAAATSIVFFVADYIAEGLLREQGSRVLRELFGDPNSPDLPKRPDLPKLVRDAFALLLPRLQNVPRESNFQDDIDNTLSALDALCLLLKEHLNNPPPQGPRDRISSANEQVILLTNALARLGILGFHNYLISIGFFLLVLVERARFDGEAEMKSACQQLGSGIDHAEKTLLEWRKWNDSRFRTRSTGWVHGESTITLITLDGNRYSAEGVRGWYSVDDFEGLLRELALAKDLVWNDVRSQFDLQQADVVIQKWKDLKAIWVGLGYCA